MQAAADQFSGPSNRELLAPVSTMCDHPLHNARRIRSNAQIAIGELNLVANAEWDYPMRHGPLVAEEAQAAREFWQGYLETVRHVHKQLLDGIAIQRFRREVKRLAADLATPLDEAIAGAIEQCRQIRAFHAVMLGESDDLEMGVDVLPPTPGPGYQPIGGKSVPFEW